MTGYSYPPSRSRDAGPPSGPLPLPDGTAAIPALTFTADTDTGLFRPGANQIGMTAGGTSRLTATPQGAVIAGTLTVESSGTHRVKAAGQLPEIMLERYAGTLAAPTATQANDILGRFVFGGHTGAGETFNRAGLWCRAVETFTASANGTQFEMWTTPTGSTTTARRLTVEATGAVNLETGPLKMAGAEVLNSARHLVLRAYTVATLPTAAVAGQLVHVSNGSANRYLAISDGSQWRFQDGSVVS